MNKQRYEINMIKRFFWSSLSLPAYGQVEQGQHSLAAHFALRNTKFGGAVRRPRNGFQKIGMSGFGAFV